MSTPNASRKMKKTGISELPAGWKMLAVGDCAALSIGHGFTPKDWNTSGLPIIRIQNLNGSRKFNHFTGNPEADWIVMPGELLFAWAGVKGVSFGPTVWPGPKGVLNQHIYRIHPSAEIDKTWLYLALRDVTQRIEAKAHGFKSSLVHVQKSEIVGARLLVPPLPEQRRIAGVLGACGPPVWRNTPSRGR